MPARITQLIDKVDNSELIRDELAAILAVESAAQQVLATAGGKDPRLWVLRVFVERSDPWEQFVDVPDQLDAAPIVNINYEGATFDKASSNGFERQRAQGVFNLDCYGYGVSAETEAGHDAGDEVAAKEAQRALRLVRNILMSGHYMYLGLPRGSMQVVWSKWVQSTTVFKPTLDGRPIQNVIGARLALQVDFTEFSPQVQTETLDLIFATVKRAENGEIYLTAQYGEEDDP